MTLFTKSGDTYEQNIQHLRMTFFEFHLRSCAPAMLSLQALVFDRTQVCIYTEFHIECIEFSKIQSHKILNFHDSICFAAGHI